MASHREPEPRPINAVFIGAGAVGCFYASRLHHLTKGNAACVQQPRKNVRVSLVARSNYKAIAASGVKLETHSFGDYVFAPEAAYPSVTAAAEAVADWDYIFVTTKALPDRSDDAAMIAPLVGPASCIVLIQNGVGVEAPFRARFPDTPVVSGVTVVSAEQTSPGRIVTSTERNAGARPSMLLDWEARRPLELEVILGNPVRIARARGVEMPRLQSLYALLKSAQTMREQQQQQQQQQRQQEAEKPSKL
ncbi:Translation machinery-associated protein 20 [Verticillium dahliae VDG2]|nr:Translation machinery-associated protein 20 [Verticillium dahliae VDG2]